MFHYDSDLDIVVGNTHQLLDPQPPAYSNLTVRRAFIVWWRSGQKNKFRDVCNYYHHLEAMEEKMSASDRAKSRHHEFYLFSNHPFTSSYLREHHPFLYLPNYMHPYFIRKLESIKNERCLFKLEGFHKLREPGVTSKQIQDTSKVIRHHCQTHLISPRKFLEEFREYADECGINPSMKTVSTYIKKKAQEAELQLIQNCPTTFSFLEEDSDGEEETLGEAVPKEEKKTESDKLKMLLGINNKAEKIEELNKSAVIEKSNSCAEFFNLFRDNKLRTKRHSLVQLPLTFEDFAKVLNQNPSKIGSVENIKECKDLISFELNQCAYDSRMNDFETVREI